MLLRDAISVLNTRLARETDGNSRKDSKRLKEIMITAHEWDLIQNLVDVLEPFAESTDYLDGIVNSLYSELRYNEEHYITDYQCRTDFNIRKKPHYTEFYVIRSKYVKSTYIK